MIDTVYLTKTIENIGEIDIRGWEIKRLPNAHLKEATKNVYLDDLNGNEKPIRFSFNNFTKSLLISFSAPNLLYGTSLYEINVENDYDRLNTILQNKLDDFSDLDISDFNISRLDICVNIEYKYAIGNLVNLLNNSTPNRIGNKSKHIYDTTFSLYNNSETFNLYDKIANEKEKQHFIPSEFLNKNILRFELQIRKKELFGARCRFGRYLHFADLLIEQDRIKELLFDQINITFKNTFSITSHLEYISQYLIDNGKKNINDLTFFLLLYNNVLQFSQYELLIKSISKNNSQRNLARDLKKWKTFYALLVNYKPQKHFQDILDNIREKLELD